MFVLGPFILLGNKILICIYTSLKQYFKLKTVDYLHTYKQFVLLIKTAELSVIWWTLKN